MVSPDARVKTQYGAKKHRRASHVEDQATRAEALRDSDRAFETDDHRVYLEERSTEKQDPEGRWTEERARMRLPGRDAEFQARGAAPRVDDALRRTVSIISAAAGDDDREAVSRLPSSPTREAACLRLPAVSLGSFFESRDQCERRGFTHPFAKLYARYTRHTYTRRARHTRGTWCICRFSERY